MKGSEAVEQEPLHGAPGSGAAAPGLGADPTCEVDLEAIGHNLSVLRSRLKPATGIISVVKADAYGHGAPQVACYLEGQGVSFFAVATVGEGVELRKHGITGRILVLIPVLPFDLEEAIRHDLTVSLASLKEGELLSRIARHLGRTARAHLMVDTGLSRGGFRPGEVHRAAPALRSLRGVTIDGIWGHFARVRPLREARAVAREFREVTAAVGQFISLPHVHMASSQAVADLPESHFSLVRPGLGLYGYLPQQNEGFSLRPAMRITAPVVSVKRYPTGTSVSYERTYVLKKPSTIATIRFGYADGYEFGLSNAGQVAIEDTRYTVVGRVTMDQLLVDVGNDPVLPGHHAVLLGAPGPTAAELAAEAGTIPYALLTAVGRRVRRTWLDGQPR